MSRSLMAPRPARKVSRRRPAAARLRFVVQRASHRLRGARWRPSPNCDARPDPADISLLVIHAISLPPGRFGGGHVDELFTNTLDPAGHPYFKEIHRLRVSSHLCVFRDGGVAQYVPFDRRAWHAGESRFDGRVRCNDFSIGIELEGSDERPFESLQYRRLGEIVGALLRAYPGLSLARIVGHSDIAPGRKTDPGPHFDWQRLRAEVEAA
ncbi:MAG TPA: 1,6-anhydro-N-acetylmuramyl-L-alanine amidase AmpD [Verrucomicrobiae bacterium]|nr:1,6-anhydro-N-acetylmuramyl-L-alanine amidase AmpD [Verrucomicrobiae bacterium]